MKWLWIALIAAQLTTPALAEEEADLLLWYGTARANIALLLAPAVKDGEFSSLKAEFSQLHFRVGGPLDKAWGCDVRQLSTNEVAEECVRNAKLKWMQDVKVPFQIGDASRVFRNGKGWEGELIFRRGNVAVNLYGAFPTVEEHAKALDGVLVAGVLQKRIWHTLGLSRRIAIARRQHEKKTPEKPVEMDPDMRSSLQALTGNLLPLYPDKLVSNENSLECSGGEDWVNECKISVEECASPQEAQKRFSDFAAKQSKDDTPGFQIPLGDESVTHAVRPRESELVEGLDVTFRRDNAVVNASFHGEFEWARAKALSWDKALKEGALPYAIHAVADYKRATQAAEKASQQLKASEERITELLQKTFPKMTIHFESAWEGHATFWINDDHGAKWRFDVKVLPSPEYAAAELKRRGMMLQMDPPNPYTPNVGEASSGWTRDEDGYISFQRADSVVNINGAAGEIETLAAHLDGILKSGELQRLIRDALKARVQRTDAEAEKQTAKEAMTSAPKSQVKAWIERLDHGKFESDYERDRILLKVGNARDPDSLPVIIQHLDDSKYDPMVCEHAMQILGDIGDPRAIAPLAALLDRPIRPTKRHTVAENLELQDQKDFSDSEELFRRCAADALARFEDPAVRPILKKIAEREMEYKSVKKIAKQRLDYLHEEDRMERERREAEAQEERERQRQAADQ